MIILKKLLRTVNNMFKLPFSWLPAHWGTTGKTRKKLEAEYKFKGEPLEYRMAEINYEEDSIELAVALIKIDLKYKKINKIESEKKIATLKGEPWVGTISSEYKKGRGTDGFSFELDWNNEFVVMLREAGYDGLTDNLTVEEWFEDVTKNELVDLIGEDIDDDEKDFTIPKTQTTEEIIDDNGTEKKKYS